MFPLLVLLFSLVPLSDSSSGPHLVDLDVLLPPRMTNLSNIAFKDSMAAFHGFLEFLFGIHIRYHNINDYLQVDILLIITVMAHIFMVVEPMSEIWVDRREKIVDFPTLHFFTMIAYLVSACYGLRVVSEHHIVMFTSAGARAIMEFILIIIISLRRSICAALWIGNLSAFVGVVAYVVYVNFLTTHQKAYEVVFGVASTIMTMFMAITSVRTTAKKVKSSKRRLGVVSFIAPFSLLTSSILWLVFAKLEDDIYTAVASGSLIMAGMLQAILLYDSRNP